MGQTPRVHAQPLIAVADVDAARRWYAHVLGADIAHGGDEYGQLHSGGELVLQLHDQGTDHHHGPIATPGVPVGNGVLVWFSLEDFDAAVERGRAAGTEIVRDVHVNPNANHREFWFRDLDGYTVVLAEPFPA